MTQTVQRFANTQELPSLFSLYLKAMFSRSKTPHVFEGQLIIDEFYFDQKQWQHYLKLFEGSRSSLMIPFVFVATQKAQLLLMTSKESHLNVMGLIHRSIQFQVHKPICIRDRFQFRVRCSKQEITSLGFEFELTGELFNENQDMVAEYKSCYLIKASKKPRRAKAKGNSVSLKPQDYRSQKSLILKSVKDYAWVSKDLNPIHLKGFCKAFGFKSPIVHGMYMVAWICSQWQSPLGKMNFQFLRPAILPTELTLCSNEESSVVFNSKNKPNVLAQKSDQSL